MKAKIEINTSKFFRLIFIAWKLLENIICYFCSIKYKYNISKNSCGFIEIETSIFLFKSF